MRLRLAPYLRKPPPIFASDKHFIQLYHWQTLYILIIRRNTFSIQTRNWLIRFDREELPSFNSQYLYLLLPQLYQNDTIVSTFDTIKIRTQ